MPEENRQPHLGAPPGGSTCPSAHLGPEPQDPESPGSSPRPCGLWEGSGLGGPCVTPSTRPRRSVPRFPSFAMGTWR